MSDVVISYKGSAIASMSASGTKTLLTSSKYCEDDITVQYTKTVYNGEHHQPTPPPQIIKTVMISLTNPISPSDFIGCTVYDAPTSTSEPENSLGTIGSASGSVAVTVPAESFGVVLEIYSNWGASIYSGMITCTGGVSYTGADAMLRHWFEVVSDGTITIDGIDYSD